MFLFLTLAFAIADAKAVARLGQKAGSSVLKRIQVDQTLANKPISPALKPESHESFEKDYTGDKRPGVDVLHFNHPYPVVQDSEEFDKDFVKDENNDNGQWKTQEEYDRLRHKLTKLRKEAAEALAKKNKEEQDLNNIMREYQEDMATTPAPPPKKDVTVKKEVKKEESSWSWEWPWTWKTPEAKKVPAKTTTPAPPPKPKDLGVDDAAEDVKKAMEHLKGCQNELEIARAELKKLMEELEKAKVKQIQAREKINEEMIHELEAETHEEQMHNKFKEEASEHAAAKAAYLKQKAVVDKLRADLEAAAAKVKAMRAAEDKQGGVYPTPKKNAARSNSVLHIMFFACAASIGQMVF